MALESYKKWIVAAVILLFAGIVVISTITSNRQKAVQEARQSESVAPPPAGPLMGDIAKRVVPVEDLGVNTKDPGAMATIGDQYFESSNFEQAIEIYTKVIELKPDDVDTYNDLGLSYHYKGSVDEAVATLKKGTGIAPSYQRIWLSLGYVLMSNNRMEEARPALQKAVQLNPDSIVGKEAARMLGLIKQ